MPSNDERIASARDAIEQYLEGGDNSTQEALTDLLTNLRHLADEEGIDFGEASQMSEIHFEEER